MIQKSKWIRLKTITRKLHLRIDYLLKEYSSDKLSDELDFLLDISQDILKLREHLIEALDKKSISFEIYKKTRIVNNCYMKD